MEGAEKAGGVGGAGGAGGAGGGGAGGAGGGGWRGWRGNAALEPKCPISTTRSKPNSSTGEHLSTAEQRDHGPGATTDLRRVRLP